MDVQFSRYCDWRIKLPKGFQVVADILDLDISLDPDHARIGYSVVVGISNQHKFLRFYSYTIYLFALQFYNDFRFKSRIKVVRQNGTMELIKSSSNTMMISYSSSPGYRGFKLRYYAQAPARTFIEQFLTNERSNFRSDFRNRWTNERVIIELRRIFTACGGVRKDMNGTLSAPKTAPFNESSYFCQWSIEAPESLANNTDNTGVTLAVKVTGTVGNSRGYVFSRFCYNFPHISLTGESNLPSKWNKKRSGIKYTYVILSFLKVSVWSAEITRRWRTWGVRSSLTSWS